MTVPIRLCLHRRSFSSAAPGPQSPESQAQVPPPPPPRWISELRARIGKCLAFGCNAQQVSQAAGVLRVIATEWKELLAASEGFLTGGRRGLDSREIAWGEMDSFVGTPCPTSYSIGHNPARLLTPNDTISQGHVNNVNYYRYAESARVNWITNFAVHVDPEHRTQWRELMSPRSTGLIMRSLKADFKFVRAGFFVAKKPLPVPVG